MKTTLLNRMGSFVLGGGTGVTVALASLALWTGTTDLQAIKTSVEQYTLKADGQVSALLGEYNVTVNSANAEIGEYKVALQQANDNISQLITAYETKVDEYEDKVTELGNANTKYETDLKDLQTKLAEMETRLNSQYETDMNEVVEKANEQINAANTEVASTKTQVETIINGSGVSNFTIDDHKEHLNKLDKTGDKSVTDISSIVPTVPQN